MCVSVQVAVTSSFLAPNTLPSTLFSNTLRLCSSLNVRDRISDPYRTTSKIIMLWEQWRCRQNLPHDLRTHTLSLNYSMTPGRGFGPPPLLNILLQGKIWGSHSSAAEDTTNLGNVFSIGEQLPTFLDGLCGLMVSMLASGSRVRGFDPDRSHWIFSDVKKSSACLPSEGK
jgi:hypothetical protein